MAKKPQKLTVDTDPTLERDSVTKAIINRSASDYHRRLSVKRANNAKDQELLDLRREVNRLTDLVTNFIDSQQRLK